MVGESRLRTAAKTVCVVLLGLFIMQPAFAQLDPADPWPEYYRDERNSGYSPNRGPHMAPVLRWWAKLGPEGDTVDVQRHWGGAAIFKHDGQSYVAVGSPDGYLRIFRTIQPNEPVISLPPDIGPIWLGLGNPGQAQYLERMQSTPLVLPNGNIVVRTHLSVQEWDVFNDIAPGQWRWRLVLDEPGSRGSPTYGNAYVWGKPRLFVQEPHRLICIELTDSAPFHQVEFTVQCEVDLPNSALHTPALGPNVPQDIYERNLVYLSVRGQDANENSIFAHFADSGALAWQAPFRQSGGGLGGTDASPSLFPNADARPVIGSEDGALYGLFNAPDARLFDPNAPDPCVGHSDYLRWCDPPDISGGPCSSTAAVTPTNDAFVFNEADSVVSIFQFKDLTISGVQRSSKIVLDNPHTRWAFQSVSADSHRICFGTIASASQTESRDRSVVIWSYDPAGELELGAFEALFSPADDGDARLRQSFRAPIAIDEDGTLIAVNNGYVFALRVYPGDPNGDRCRNNEDIDAFVLALIDPSAWEAQYGSVFGLNRIGVCDCNNDGLVNNDDIDAFVALVLCCTECPGVTEFAGPVQAPAEDEWTYFWEQVALLHAYFGE